MTEDPTLEAIETLYSAVSTLTEVIGDITVHLTQMTGDPSLALSVGAKLEAFTATETAHKLGLGE